MRLVGTTMLVAVALGGLAVAQPKPRSTELFEQGRELAAQNKFAEACDKFAESLALDRAPGTALNYGNCLEKLGKLRAAWHMFDEAANAFARDKDTRAEYARQRADAVLPQLAHLTIEVANPALAGLVVEIAGEPVTIASQIADHVEPGDVAITARAPGFTELTVHATAVAGAPVTVAIPATLGGPVGGVHVGRRDRTRVRIALIAGGVGVASLVTSGVLGLSAKSTYDDALDGDCSDASGSVVCTTEAGKAQVDKAVSRANLGTGFAIAGGVLVGAAAVLYFTAPRESLQVAPTATATSVGVAFCGRF